MNIYDVAKVAGVSPATVSRVLNGNGSVKQSTRDKVLAIINGAGYVPNALARNLSVGGTQTIAFLVPDIENPFFSKILHGITDKAMEYDYNVFMFGTDENTEREHRILSSLNAEMIKGMIIIPVAEEDGVTKQKLTAFEERGIPVVLLDRDMEDGGFDGIFSEDRVGSVQAVECLIQEGHREIAIIAGPETSRPGRERLRGYQKALESHGLPVKREYIVNGNFREEESYAAMKLLMEASPRPTAIFTSNNLTTLGALKYMKDHGLRLVEDISLIGFDDIPELLCTDMCLTVVTRPVYEMGCEAMSLLQQRFAERERPAEGRSIVRRNLVRTSLIRRGSEKRKPPSKTEGE